MLHIVIIVLLSTLKIYTSQKPHVKLSPFYMYVRYFIPQLNINTLIFIWNNL